MVLGTVAFGGIGLLLAGTLKPLVNLAVVNALFVVLLLLGGMLIPLAKLPGWLAGVAQALPASALADALHRTLGHGIAGDRPGLGRARRLGGRRTAGRRAGRSAGNRCGAGRSAARRDPGRRAVGQLEVIWLSSAELARFNAPSLWPTTWPDASMKKVFGSPFSP